jgi:hydrogenase expression/formation protein HypD
VDGRDKPGHDSSTGKAKASVIPWRSPGDPRDKPGHDDFEHTMKYVDEFRDGRLAQVLAGRIAGAARPERSYSLMEFCGGHTHAISRYGVADLLPPNVRMIHGPGCPVCVLPIGRLDLAIGLALERGVVLCSYGDTLRVPASSGLSLLRARARGADVRMVYSAADAIAIARAEPAREVVFLAIGFETTTPPTALVIRQAAESRLANFSVLCNHVLTPSAITHILESPEVRELGTVPIDGFIGPAHVSTVIGSRPYEFFAEEYGKPVVIAGFEPLDVMLAIAMLIDQINEGRAEVENEFTRAVTREGNLKAQALVSEVFELRRSFEWRGLGEVPYSALRIRDAYRDFDAERRYALEYRPVADNKACECGAILRGVRRPADCRLFGSVCTPEHPIGSCMVSSEGACAAHYAYGRFKDALPVAAS